MYDRYKAMSMQREETRVVSLTIGTLSKTGLCVCRTYACLALSTCRRRRLLPPQYKTGLCVCRSSACLALSTSRERRPLPPQ